MRHLDLNFEHLNEERRFENLKSQSKHSRLSNNVSKFRSQSRFYHDYNSNEGISEFQKDIEKLKKHHSNIHYILLLLKKKKNKKKVINFKLNLHSPQQTQLNHTKIHLNNIAKSRPIKQSSFSVLHMKTMNFNFKNNPSMQSSEVPVISPTLQLSHPIINSY